MHRVHIGLDFFDASINRIAAWVIGTRNMIKALLMALLEPDADSGPSPSAGAPRRDWLRAVVGDLLESLASERPVVVVIDDAQDVDPDSLEVLEAVRSITGAEVPHRIAPRRPGDVAACFADPTRANVELGWHATRSLEDAVRDAWAWQSRYPDGYRTHAAGGV